MNIKKITKILKQHALWLQDHTTGQRADLENANLQGVDLENAELQYANFYCTNFQDANLKGVSFYGADLRYANFQNADFQNANLENTNLQNAILEDTNLTNTILPDYQIVPEEGDFIAWKTVQSGRVKVLCRGKRTSTLIGRKIRVEKVKVLTPDVDTTNVLYIGPDRIKYKTNKWTTCDSFNQDIRIECTHGIHVFLTKSEAEEWEI